MPTYAGRIAQPDVSLSDFLTSYINANYDGNQTAFARAIGFSQQYVSGLIAGRVTLPSREKRQVLCDELGVDQVDLLVMAGELTAEEAARDPEVLRRTPLGRDRDDMIDLIERLNEAQVRAVRTLLQELVAAGTGGR